MANFDTTAAKLLAGRKASGVLPNIQSIYQEMKIVQSSLALYTAGTDPTFNAAVNAFYTSAERSELGVILTGINTLVTDWETNHAGAISAT